jgi:hypothetical protein
VNDELSWMPAWELRDLAYERASSSVGRLGGRMEPMLDRPWGLRDFRMVDPDGYYLRITSHDGTPRQS